MMHNETFGAGMPAAGLPSGETPIRLRLANLVRHRRVLDLACANGRWTGVASRFAQAIVATDPSDEQFALARRRTYDCRVSFAGGIDRAAALLIETDCLLASSLLSRFGARAARSRIDHGLARVDGEVTLALLECSCPPPDALRALLPDGIDLRVERSAFVSLISCRIVHGGHRIHASTASSPTGPH